MDILEKLYLSPVGKALASRVGLAEPPVLRRGRAEPDGPLAVHSIAGGRIVAETMALLGWSTVPALLDVAEARTADEKGRAQPPRYDTRPGALIVDATGLTRIAQLEELRQALRPAMKGLERSGRVVIVGDDPAGVAGREPRAVAQTLDGVVRTIAKELRGGGTANLIQIRDGAGAADVASSLSFLVQGRSAYVDGQVWRIGRAAEHVDVVDRPFAGRIVAVTGAARGIGAAIARTFARDGADVVCIDIPPAGQALAAVANDIRGTALQLDVTAADAGARIAEHVVARHGADARLWAVVHNAGITRDRMLANLDEKGWAQVLEVNLAAQIRMNDALLADGLPGGLARPGRIVGVASTSGIAGNKGQTNYAASKAGVIGLVSAMADELDEVTVNAVAPGFIATDMTAKIPFVQREMFQRLNSLSQAGQPVDVAETICWLADPASGGLDGQVVRVCGQNVVGQ